MDICNRKMIQFMPANHSITNRVITFLIHSDKTLFQNVLVTLLHCLAKDVTLSLLLWHKHKFSTSQPMKMCVTNIIN